jgi:hypothetical protein
VDGYRYGEGAVGPALRTGNNTQVQFEFKQSAPLSSLDLEGAFASSLLLTHCLLSLVALMGLVLSSSSPPSWSRRVCALTQSVFAQHLGRVSTLRTWATPRRLLPFGRSLSLLLIMPRGTPLPSVLLIMPRGTPLPSVLLIMPRGTPLPSVLLIMPRRGTPLPFVELSPLVRKRRA